MLQTCTICKLSWICSLGSIIKIVNKLLLLQDITQQNLCNLTAVGLVEKCVRFHIYAAHRLCEEPPHVFDVKINNENLTKCLQTLKEFYQDMKEKHFTVCPNEAEFRSYMVLMNLNEGDALRFVFIVRSLTIINCL